MTNVSVLVPTCQPTIDLIPKRDPQIPLMEQALSSRFVVMHSGPARQHQYIVWDLSSLKLTCGSHCSPMKRIRA
jgi:hypothetical protein